MARKATSRKPKSDKQNGKTVNPKVGEWPADRVKRMSVDALLPYARNARIHSPEQIEKVAKSIETFGFTNPVIVDHTGEIIAGHGRLMASRRLGITEVPTIVIAKGEWTEEKKRAYRLADNQLALLADWDPGLLKVELSELKLADFDLSLTGFDSASLVSFMAFGGAGGNSDPEATPEPPTEPVSRLGDIWVMGSHRLLCGDCTSKDDVGALLGKQRPHLMVTDPPYGVDYDPDWRNQADRANGKPYGARAVGLVTNDDRSDWSDAWKLFPGDVIYAWHPPLGLQVVHYESLVKSGFEVRSQVIWGKQQFAIGRGHYHIQHEGCWYAVRKGKTAHWNGDRKQTTLWQIDKPHKSETGHSTQKPIECMKRPIENNSQPGDLVYDPFLGSGTTLIAAEMTGRACMGMEIDPVYVDVIVQRWQTFTQQKAILSGTGKTFDEIARERGIASRAAEDRKEAVAAI